MKDFSKEVLNLSRIEGAVKCAHCLSTCGSFPTCPKVVVKCVGEACQQKCEKYQASEKVSMELLVEVVNNFKSRFPEVVSSVDCANVLLHFICEVNSSDLW